MTQKSGRQNCHFITLSERNSSGFFLFKLLKSARNTHSRTKKHKNRQKKPVYRQTAPCNTVHSATKIPDRQQDSRQKSATLQDYCEQYTETLNHQNIDNQFFMKKTQRLNKTSSVAIPQNSVAVHHFQCPHLCTVIQTRFTI